MASELIATYMQKTIKIYFTWWHCDIWLGDVTSTGVQIYRKERNNVEKRFFHWSDENTPPQEFLRNVREMQGQRTKEYLGSLLNQDLVLNFQTKSTCKCPNFSKLTRKHKPRKSDDSQDKHVTTPD